MTKKDFYKIEIVSKAPALKTKSIKLEELNEEQKKDFAESKTENKGKAAWLMPSGSIFWAHAGIEMNQAKKILFKEEKGKTKKEKTKAKKKR
jgi:hypothetical protein